MLPILLRTIFGELGDFRFGHATRGKCCPFFGSGLTLNSSLSDFGIRFGYEDALFFTPELLWERCNFKIECLCAADVLSAKLWCKIGEDAALLMQQFDFDFTAYCPFQLGWMLPKISLSAFWDASTVQLYHRARKQAAPPLLQQSLGGQKKSSSWRYIRSSEHAVNFSRRASVRLGGALQILGQQGGENAVDMFHMIL